MEDQAKYTSKQIEELPKICFSNNWNSKLFCKYHSTIRLRNDKKYKLDQSYVEICKDSPLGIVKIVSLCHFNLDRLTSNMAYLDTGYNKLETIKMMQTMYKNSIPDVMVVEWSYIILMQIHSI